MIDKKTYLNLLARIEHRAQQLIIAKHNIDTTHTEYLCTVDISPYDDESFEVYFDEWSAHTEKSYYIKMDDIFLPQDEFDKLIETYENEYAGTQRHDGSN